MPYVRDKRSPAPKSEAVSRVMSSNRAKDSAPELLLRRALWKAGLRGYRLHRRIALDGPARHSSPVTRHGSVRPDISYVWTSVNRYNCGGPASLASWVGSKQYLVKPRFKPFGERVKFNN